jgi:predicted O-methyltransferase YrrM
MNFDEAWEKIKDVEGLLCSPHQEKWLFNAASESNGDVLEIGSFMGRSTCCLALGMLGTHKRVFALDPFDSSFFKQIRHKIPDDYFQVFKENIQICGVEDHVIILKGFSNDFADKFHNKLGMLFIDGSHKYEDVIFDYETFSPFVKQGGIIAFHDVDRGHGGSRRAWREVAPSLDKRGNCKNLAYGYKR